MTEIESDYKEKPSSKETYDEIPFILPEEAAKPFTEGTERPVSSVYPVIDTDLARDNLENDIPEADLQDL